ncbi:MAG: hypothetical protein Kow009_02330 [Spirochaetales bacterium]
MVHILVVSTDSCWMSISWSGEQGEGVFPSGYISLSCAGDLNPWGPSRQRVLEEVAKLFPGRKFLYCRQEHTRIVRHVSRNDDPGYRGDGLLTEDPEVVLGITVADCLPILLFDPRNQVRGLLHSGWKGTGILREAVEVMCARYGTDPRDLYVLFGPSIRSCCYRVDANRAEWFLRHFGRGTAVNREGSFYVDLVQANRNIAETMGVHSVQVVGGCTFCDTRFHSYRRMGPSEFQRMLVLF